MPDAIRVYRFPGAENFYAWDYTKTLVEIKYEPRTRLNEVRLAVFSASGGLGSAVVDCCNARRMQQIPESGPDPSYRDVVATYLKTTFKEYNKYEGFQISAPRRVRSFHGLDWISCVRFSDAGHRRNYAVFINGKTVVEGRYANQTDECARQECDSFGQLGGSFGLDPLH